MFTLYRLLLFIASWKFLFIYTLSILNFFFLEREKKKRTHTISSFLLLLLFTKSNYACCFACLLRLFKVMRSCYDFFYAMQYGSFRSFRFQCLLLLFRLFLCVVSYFFSWFLCLFVVFSIRLFGHFYALVCMCVFRLVFILCTVAVQSNRTALNVLSVHRADYHARVLVDYDCMERYGLLECHSWW